jgi:arsenate reductase (thioredoxin)
MERRTVLILCTGNSARSQMAEGLVNRYLSGSWKAYSAGTKPSGYVHPLAVKAMAALGIDISGRRSKPLDEFRGRDFDLVITVCDHANRECPVWLGKSPRVHVAFPDPAAAKGSEAERLARFSEIRDAIRKEVLGLLREWKTPTSEADNLIAQHLAFLMEL